MIDKFYEKLRYIDLVMRQLDKIVEKKTWGGAVLALYQILDDISTVDDMCKENILAFHNMVMKFQAKKNQYLYSPDGSTIKKVNEDMTSWAKRELELAGLFDKDSDYNGMIGEAVLNLIQKLAEQGHSGMSAAWTVDLFTRLANYKPLTELTDIVDEWNDISKSQSGEPGWQSQRSPTCFSLDGGKTYYDIDEDYYKYTDENGDTWSGGLSKEQWKNKPMHQSKHIE